MKPVISVAAAALVCGTIGLFCVVWTFRLFEQGHYLSMSVVGGFAVFAFGLLSMRVIVALRWVQPRVEYGVRGILVRPDLKVDLLVLMSTLAGFVSMLLYAIFGSFGKAELPGPARDQTWFVLMSAAGVIVGLPSLRRIVTQGGMGCLRLSDSGIEVRDAYSRTEYAWDELSGVSDQSRHRQWAHPRGTSYLTTSDGRTRVLASDWYTPDGLALRRLLRFYWQHPECRDELTDDRPAQRLREQWWAPT